MSLYLNKGNEGFRRALTGEYVDKTGMISIINATLETERYCSCVTRSRRFGKTMAAEMLCAYYDESCDSSSLFAGLKISEDSSYQTYLNKFPVIYVSMTDFTTAYRNERNIVKRIKADIKDDLYEVYRDLLTENDDNLIRLLLKVRQSAGKPFIMIIDEWDAILRECGDNDAVVDEYVDFLRSLFKGSNSKSIFAGVYMTGILPVKKYNMESALNNFREYSVINPEPLSCYFGFTRAEVEDLCAKYKVDFQEMARWYDGYKIGEEISVFNPYSVIEALQKKSFKSYWSGTKAYESLRDYIQSDFDGLKDDIIKMLAGERCRVNTAKFQNDMKVVGSEDDVLTMLIHLGYLSYDDKSGECYIPNKEVADEFTNAIEDTSWKSLAASLKSSRNLLEATLACDEVAVAKGIDLAHDANTSILSYNDENSLACVLSMAYYWAQNNYIIHRELATGKGFADMVLIPRRNVDSPALVIELKFDKAVDTAIDQIKRKEYPVKVAEYTDNMLLVGISYDKETKHHSCRIMHYGDDFVGHEYMDLGLPSGLLWATCNVGAKKSRPTDYGEYFAWGETKPKDDYAWDGLKYCDDKTGDTFSKYNLNKKGNCDGEAFLLDEYDDAASVNWGGSWRMPTKEEWEELQRECIWTWENRNGHFGYKVERNDKSIFLPASGYKAGIDSPSDMGSSGFYWSSSLHPEYPDLAYGCRFSSDDVDSSDWDNRYYGNSVRPVAFPSST